MGSPDYFFTHRTADENVAHCLHPAWFRALVMVTMTIRVYTASSREMLPRHRHVFFYPFGVDVDRPSCRRGGVGMRGSARSSERRQLFWASVLLRGALAKFRLAVSWMGYLFHTSDRTHRWTWRGKSGPRSPVANRASSALGIRLDGTRKTK